MVVRKVRGRLAEEGRRRGGAPRNGERTVGGASGRQPGVWEEVPRAFRPGGLQVHSTWVYRRNVFGVVPERAKDPQCIQRTV